MLEVPGDSDYSGQLIPSWLKKTSTVPILPMEVAKASFEQISAVVLSQAYSDPMVAAVVTLSSQVVSDDGGEEIVGSWIFWYWYWGGPSLLPRNSGMVEDLDKSWVFWSGFFLAEPMATAISCLYLIINTRSQIFCSYFLSLWYLDFNFMLLNLSLCSCCFCSRHI